MDRAVMQLSGQAFLFRVDDMLLLQLLDLSLCFQCKNFQRTNHRDRNHNGGQRSENDRRNSSCSLKGLNIQNIPRKKGYGRGNQTAENGINAKRNTSNAQRTEYDRDIEGLDAFESMQA